MDRYVTATEANQRFSELFQEVQRGNTIAVMSRGKVAMKMIPADGKSQKRPVSEVLAELEKLPRRTYNWRRDDLYD